MNSVGIKSFLTNYGIYILLFILAVVALGISIGAFTKKCKFEAFGWRGGVCGSDGCDGKCIASMGEGAPLLPDGRTQQNACENLVPNSLANVNSRPDNDFGALATCLNADGFPTGWGNMAGMCSWKCGNDGEWGQEDQLTNKWDCQNGVCHGQDTAQGGIWDNNDNWFPLPQAGRHDGQCAGYSDVCQFSECA